MLLETLIQYLALLGVGGFIGVVTKSVLDKRLKEKEMLFSARVQAYRGISGRMLNLFNELDLNPLPEAIRVSKIHQLLSELYLVGSKDLVDMLGDYKKTLFEFHNELEEVVKDKTRDETKSKRLYAELSKKTAELMRQMRKDIYINTSLEDSEDIAREMGFSDEKQSLN